MSTCAPPVEAVRRRRRYRHRPVLGASGIVMFVCLFLPAMRTCDHPDYPLDHFPYFTAPYFLGLAIATFAFVVGPRTLALAFAVTRALLAAVLVGALSMVVEAPVFAIFEVCIALGFIAIVGVRRRDEHALSIFAVALGAAETCWFLMVAAPPDGMIGGQLALVAGIGTMLGGMLWGGNDVTAPLLEPPSAVARR